MAFWKAKERELQEALGETDEKKLMDMYFGSLDEKDPTRLKESIRNAADQSSASRVASAMNDVFNEIADGVKPARKKRLPVFEAICPSDGHNKSHKGKWKS